MIYANLSLFHKQEQKVELKLEQVQLVRCLIAYIEDRKTFVPIKIDVSTRKAKKTGYAFAHPKHTELDDHILWLNMFGVPEDLKEVCYIPEYDGIER